MDLWEAVRDHIHRFFGLPEEVKHFYILAVFRTMLLSSGALFLPIYIYTSMGSVSTALLYAALSYGFFRTLLKPFSVWIMNNLSVEHNLLFSILSLTAAYSLVYVAGVNTPFLFLVALFEAAGFSLYWDSYHASFGLFGRKKDIGEEVAGAYILTSVISLLMPALSAITVKFWGFHAFYTIVSIISILGSILFLLNFRALYRAKLSIRKMIFAPLKLFHTVEGVHLAMLNIAALYIFLVFSGALLKLGGLYSAVALATMVGSHLVGRYFDAHRDYNLGRISYAVNSLYALLVALVPKPLLVSLVELSRWFFSAFGIAFYGVFYTAVKAFPELTVSRSLYISLAKGIFFFFLFFLGGEMEALKMGMIISFLAGLGVLLLYNQVVNLARQSENAL